MSTLYSCHEKRLELRNGDSMHQAEFHALYEQMPETFKAELIGGTVFVSMPISRPHSQGHILAGALLAAYAAHTPGTEAFSECTIILGKEDEVQPDLALRLLPSHGGNTSHSYSEYLIGPPELICEIAYTSRAIDLHLKRKRYAKAGVKEYIVLCLHPRQIHWFNFAERNLIEPNSSGIFCSKVFPGLWLDRQGLLDLDYHKAMATIDNGLASEEHAIFAKQIESSST